LNLKITGYKAGIFYIVEKPARKYKEVIFKYNRDDEKHQQLFNKYDPHRFSFIVWYRVGDRLQNKPFKALH
jgi:hypothetical protein